MASKKTKKPKTIPPTGRVRSGEREKKKKTQKKKKKKRKQRQRPNLRPPNKMNQVETKILYFVCLSVYFLF
jgi:hypothetical protein